MKAKIANVQSKFIDLKKSPNRKKTKVEQIKVVLFIARQVSPWQKYVLCAYTF